MFEIEQHLYYTFEHFLFCKGKRKRKKLLVHVHVDLVT